METFPSPMLLKASGGRGGGLIILYFIAQVQKIKIQNFESRRRNKKKVNSTTREQRNKL